MKNYKLGNYKLVSASVNRFEFKPFGLRDIPLLALLVLWANFDKIGWIWVLILGTILLGLFNWLEERSINKWIGSDMKLNLDWEEI